MILLVSVPENLMIASSLFVCRVQAVFDKSGLRHPFNIPVAYSQFQHIGSSIHVHQASQYATKDAMSLCEVPLHCRWNHNGMPSDTDMRFMTGARLQSSHYEPQKLPPTSANYLYLQDLKDFVTERRGVLGDGWHVEFHYCPVRCKTSAIYCAPDGRKFESMSSVADCLGLVPSGHALEDDNRGNGVPPGQKSHKRKEGTRYSGAKYSRENKIARRSILGGKSPPSAEVVSADIRRSNQSKRPEPDQNKIDDTEHQHFCVCYAIGVLFFCSAFTAPSRIQLDSLRMHNCVHNSYYALSVLIF